MAYVITQPCVCVKTADCVATCPVDCIYEGEDQYYINPVECIDCDECRPACPEQAIFPQEKIPPKWLKFIELNRQNTANYVKER